MRGAGQTERQTDSRMDKDSERVRGEEVIMSLKPKQSLQHNAPFYLEQPNFSTGETKYNGDIYFDPKRFNLKVQFGHRVSNFGKTGWSQFSVAFLLPGDRRLPTILSARVIRALVENLVVWLGWKPLLPLGMCTCPNSEDNLKSRVLQLVQMHPTDCFFLFIHSYIHSFIHSSSHLFTCLLILDSFFYLMADSSQTRILGRDDGQFLHARWWM